ncbi:MAG TPA: hypothetical protein VHO46_00535 [Bacteroidales bacterium]|nr:hypothetical protein [Bacteroidales bacterium]
MLTDLEKYLQENRKLLDVESPDDKLIWENIRAGMQEKKLHKPSIKFLRRVTKIAALFFIVFSIGYITKDIIDSFSGARKVQLSDFDESLARKENEYRSAVSMKLNEVKSLNATDDIIINELFSEINKLDAVYDQAFKDLKEIGYNEKIVNTIFDTYEKKIRLLELIILESNKPVQYENNVKIRL